MKECQNLVPIEAYAYDKLTGILSLVHAFVKLLNSTFLKGVKLDPGRLIITNGASSALESLLFCILDVNDGILIPAPYYFNYDNDIESRVQGKALPLHLDYNSDIKDQLNQAKIESENKGIPVRAMLVTNPQNPTGSIVPKEVLAAQAQWCAENNIHLISNEIYANSIFNPCEKEYSSLFEIGRNIEGFENHLHLLYGLSKDFGAAGLRIGMIYTDSESIVKALGESGALTSPAIPVQHQLAAMLSDLDFVDKFFKENKQRLKKSYTILTDGLKEIGIPFQEANAGLFVWVDLREFLEESNFASERKLFEKLFDYGLLLSPGELSHAPEPGFFRICFANVPRDALPLVKERLKLCFKL
eukprot:g3569.t1